MGRVRFTITFLALAVGLAACVRTGNPEAVKQPTAAPAAAAGTGAPTAADAVAGAGAAPPAGSAAPAVSAAPSTGAVSGVRVFLDPVTGEAREPTPAEAAGAAASGRVQREAVAGQAGSEGTQREHFVLPDGTEGVKLAPRDQRAVVVCRQADGSYTENCPSAAGRSGP